MEISYFVRVNYGAKHGYIVGDAAAFVQALTGQKTVSAEHIKALESLGHTLTLVADPKLATL